MEFISNLLSNIPKEIYLLFLFVSAVLRSIRYIANKQFVIPSRISKLVDASECQLFEKRERKALEDELRTAYFKRATGIPVGKQYRKEILTKLKASKGRLVLSDFRDAKYFLRYEQSDLTVNISIWDRATHYMTWLVMWLTFIPAFLLIISVPLEIQVGIGPIASLGIGLGLILIGLLFGTTTIGYYAALRVKEELPNGT